MGTTVKFLNSDPTQHNVFTPDYEKYNLGTWPQGQTKDQRVREVREGAVRATFSCAASILRWKPTWSCCRTRTSR